MQAGTVYPATAQRGRHCFIKPGHTESWGIHFFEYRDARIFQSAEAIKRLANNQKAADLFRYIPGALQHFVFALPTEGHAMTLRQKLKDHCVVMTEIYDQGRIRNFIFLDNNGIQLEAAWSKEKDIHPL